MLMIEIFTKTHVDIKKRCKQPDDQSKKSVNTISIEISLRFCFELTSLVDVHKSL